MQNKKAFAIYQQAVKNLKADPNSEIDGFIVNLWLASSSLVTKNKALTQQLSMAETAVRLLAGTVDLLETRLAGNQGGSSPVGKEWLKTLVVRDAKILGDI